tara:strand:+ start:2494 stop:3123 length:630 start_codon:yes stop_codon:yes gene_type:complete
MIAVFIINRLKNVLGKKTGNESDIVEKFTQKKSAFKESEPDSISNTTTFDNKNMHKNKNVNSSLNEILKIDSSFDTSEFISGAKKAFEFILSQYSQNNLKSLENLLSKNMLDVFQTQIKLREKKGESLEITVISVKNPEIVNAKIEKKSNALITLLFDSEQIQITKDKHGNVTDGDSNQILSIKENWSFSKNLKTKDPNWTLEKIEESN